LMCRFESSASPEGASPSHERHVKIFKVLTFGMLLIIKQKTYYLR
jgi:hypothetical protein